MGACIWWGEGWVGLLLQLLDFYIWVHKNFSQWLLNLKWKSVLLAQYDTVKAACEEDHRRVKKIVVIQGMQVLQVAFLLWNNL